MPPPQPLSIPSFATTQLLLLSAEQSAETSHSSTLLSAASPAQLAAAGLALTNLVVINQRTGMGGKNVVELERDRASMPRDGPATTTHSEHGLRVGDIVRIAEQPRGSERKRERAGMEGRGVEGVVVRSKAVGVEVAVGEQAGGDGEGLEGLGGRLWVVKLANDVTYKRMNQTMQRLQKMTDSEHTPLMRILFGLDSPTPLPETLPDVDFFDQTLNDSQRDAIRFALESREVALIHGPPGTGKTYTLLELLRQLVLVRNLRCLVCGPSNISVDNIVERLSPLKPAVPILRLGHPARLLPSVLNHSLEVLTTTSEAGGIVRDVRKEMDAKQASIKKTRNGRERRQIYGDLKDLRKEYRERERGCVSTLVAQSKVVLATLHGAGGHQLRGERFDVVIIDEASQALEAACWIPLLGARKVVLAGDHLQLPPTVKSSPASSSSTSTTSPTPALNGTKHDTKNTKAKNPPSNLETTLFTRLLSLHGPAIKRMLTTQYRMHGLISSFPSTELYDGQLTPAPAVAARLLTTLPYPVHDTDDTREPLIFYDTQGGDFPEAVSAVSTEGGPSSKEEKDEEGGTKKKQKSIMLADSKCNPSEASLAARHARSLIGAGVREHDIAVITPYNAQVSLLAGLLKHDFPALEVGSVDGFQGREKEVVVVSLVRSNVDEGGGGGGGGGEGGGERGRGEGGGGGGKGRGQAEVGFLAEKRRLNVAMTRPRRQLCVIGDSETVGRGSGFLSRWMRFLEAEAEVRYPDVGEVGAQ